MEDSQSSSSSPSAAAPDPLRYVEAVPKTGTEPFHFAGTPAAFGLLDYWRWTASDLLNNTSRGNLAEFIVARALGVERPVRATWEEYDLVTLDGVQIEVKSSAYVQGWTQTKYSRPTLGIVPSHAWDKEGLGRRAPAAARHAEVYVFCLLHHKEKSTVDPTDLSQWTFYVLPSAVLDKECPGQKSVGLGSLVRFGAEEVTFEGLMTAVEQAAGGAVVR